MSTRRCDIMQFAPKNPIGVELGVAEGVFSRMILDNYPVTHWYSIDMWAGDRGHDINQYRRAITNLISYRDKNTILKMTFQDALPLFPDDYFDVIYIDGYAHTGQDDGITLREWWPKLKSGGLFSGDDYSSSEWPKTVEQVNKFADSLGKKITQFDFINENSNHWCRFPSWYMVKD